MEDLQRFEVEITAERLAETAPWLARALQVQNARFAEQINLERHVGPARVVGLVASVAGIGGCGVLWVMDPRLATFALGFSAFFLATSVILVLAPRIRPRIRAWSRRFAGRRLTSLAERLLRTSYRPARYAVSYQAAATPGAPAAQDGRLVLSQFALALAAPGAVFLFPTARALRPGRVVLLPDAVEAERMLEALRLAGSTVDRVPEQSPPGY